MTPRTSVSARFFMIASLAGALTLTACGNTPEPQAGQSASSTGSASATATPTPTPAYKPADAKGKAENVPIPVLPEAAKANSKEGVEAFAKYWFQALSYAYETGDMAVWSAMTSAECVFCNRIKQGLESAYVKGRWVVGGKMTTPSVEANFKSEALSQQVTIQTIQSQIDYYDADGSVGQPSTPPSNSASGMIAAFESGSWKVKDLGLLR
ncbi:DUF6318 family protein [Arthrobacter sp. FW306-2-2C-D06B]|uniref:DUF6318 family protein n=1 Tax=Arthrobacter sp. FW306-2-2C-D06B TaxID=2879618 RepID=UPI001F2715F5|nr:DUF6318 family protein [Arthrobacter sp. FW306-2-2C-D06B]UKA59729.1 DUF6318 family protein [Arthrobacter sp. FW306-2-2C-D06B]